MHFKELYGETFFEAFSICKFIESDTSVESKERERKKECRKEKRRVNGTARVSMNSSIELEKMEKQSLSLGYKKIE